MLVTAQYLWMKQVMLCREGPVGHYTLKWFLHFQILLVLGESRFCLFSVRKESSVTTSFIDKFWGRNLAPSGFEETQPVLAGWVPSYESHCLFVICISWNTFMYRPATLKIWILLSYHMPPLYRKSVKGKNLSIRIQKILIWISFCCLSFVGLWAHHVTSLSSRLPGFNMDLTTATL